MNNKNALNDISRYITAATIFGKRNATFESNLSDHICTAYSNICA